METIPPGFQPSDSFIRVATACPEVAVADVATNTARITELYREAAVAQAALVVFPELSVTGYTLGDLVHQHRLLDQAEAGLQELAEATDGKDTAMVVGLPLRRDGSLFNCAAVLAKGQVQGVVPKSFLPTYNEFYEGRWFETWHGPNTTVQFGDTEVPFGTDMLFEIGGTKVGVEICEDVWVARPPSTRQALQGALVIANPSASPEQVGKADYRRNLVRMHSGQLMAGYLYAGCHTSESTSEIVMGGHQLIAVNAAVQAERKPFGSERLLITDIDTDHLEHDRMRQHMARELGGMVVRTGVERRQHDLRLQIEKYPFLPGNESAEARAERLESALNIQAYGLAMHMQAAQQKRLVLGLSGGLDSTLALLVAHRAAGILGREPADMVHTLTMPGPASSAGTQSNAQILARQLGVQNKVIPIGDIVRTELASLEHDGVTQDITYENVQARARTSLLMNYGNKAGAMVLGTGDLSELALGWCTYNGDQQSHYNVNASVPKTLVKHLVRHVSRQPQYGDARQTLEAIMDTVVSPELTGGQDGVISQSTEAQIGPYELHEFALHRLMRWGDSPDKIRYLAGEAFAGEYDEATIAKWLAVFLQRFPRNQFKRENMPSGPKVGAVSLSPRGDWRMPPALVNPALWQ